MTTGTSDTTAAGAPPAAPAPGPAPSWWRGRSELLVAALVIGIAAFLAVQTATMPVPPGTEPPGPRFFPTIVTVFMFVAGLALAVEVIRHPRRGAAEPAQAQEPAGAEGNGEAAATAATAPAGEIGLDWRTVGIVVASIVVFALLLQPVGWLLSAALLFFGVSYAMGSRRYLFDTVISLVFSSFIQLAFVGGLGLNLPAGILGGIL
ncbi:tripartite tricarboxylate transporter TctB family protein [Nocardiopsis sediminis]|uniref:Tripartite tricarboxylate transporter TctB family protein n=1 Tax=Nocardiopsis sediminis TaxID=1778267 RepID=A0ABV8FJN2_9ACTN